MRTSPYLLGLRRFGPLVLALTLASTGCGAPLSPIRLEGPPDHLRLLVGNWAGEYTSDTFGEAGGSIIFRLQAGEANAHGDVLMTRRGARTPYERYDPERGTVRSLGMSQSLSIHFVRARDAAVTGELDPYWDFDRACEARTVFHGSVRANVIEGTYETVFSGPYQRRTGKWRVARQATVIR
jgi:hypothetical protein